MKDSDCSSQTNSRRNFLKGLAATPALAFAAQSNLLAKIGQSPATGQARSESQSESKSRKFVAIQIGARSFVDEGVDSCLDTLQQKGGVNAIMATVFTYGVGLAGRQVPWEPLPDHGVQKYDSIHGGSYTRVDSKFYTGSVIKDIRAPELGDFDILADVIPRAKAKGMQTYALFEEVYNPKVIPNFEKICEIDVYGKVGWTTCFNNPYARDFLTSMVADWVTNNDLDGLMWESERQGPLNNTLGAHFIDIGICRSSISCFCEYCITKGKALGIDGQRAREGYIALDRWVLRTLAQPKSMDGTFATLWRLLLEYPEILAWERFWYKSQEEVYGLIYGTTKGISPKVQVGWHIMHLVTMSPFFRAETDYSRLRHVSDYLKPSPYNNCAGPRMAQYVRNVQSTIFRDLTPEQVLEMHYGMMGLQGEAGLHELPTVGFSGESVAVETRRAIADVDGTIPIYPGIDIDIPTGLNEKRTQPADVKAATLAALKAGASGVVLSRKYAEMKLSNLAGAGDALREFGAN